MKKILTIILLLFTFISNAQIENEKVDTKSREEEISAPMLICSNEDRDKAIDLVKRELNLTFDHPKPTTATNYSEEGQNQAKLSTELKPENYSLDKFLQLHNYEGAFANVTEYGLSTLHKDKILNLKETDFDNAIRSLDLASMKMNAN